MRGVVWEGPSVWRSAGERPCIAGEGSHGCGRGCTVSVMMNVTNHIVTGILVLKSLVPGPKFSLEKWSTPGNLIWVM